MIKCNNVQEQTQDLSAQIFQRWQALLATGDFVLGEEVAKFDAWMSVRCDRAYAIFPIQAPTLCSWLLISIILII